MINRALPGSFLENQRPEIYQEYLTSGIVELHLLPTKKSYICT